MNKSKTKRKTRSDKFPLTLHATGQYCKKIKGKIHYFGKDKKQALERYLEQAASLHNGKAKMFKTTNSNMTLKSLCNIYLQHQQAKAASGEITTNSPFLSTQFHCICSLLWNRCVKRL